MKNYIVLLIIAIVLSKPGLGQGIKDSLPAKKNELSMDLIPLIKMLSQANGRPDLKGTLQYKRQIKNKLFFRAGIIVFQASRPNKYSNIKTQYADSLNERITYEQHEYKPELNLHAGIEYRWGKRRIKQFTGMDIGYFHSKRIHSTYEAIAPHYSNYNPNYLHGEIQPNSTPAYTNCTGSYATSYNGISLNPFYGVQYHFSNRFFFSMQLGVQLQVLSGDTKAIIDDPTQQHSVGRVTTLDFDAGSILNNFSLGFRF